MMKYIKFKNQVLDYYSDQNGHVNSIYKGWNSNERVWYIGLSFKDEKIGIWKRKGDYIQTLETHNKIITSPFMKNYHGIIINFNKQYI